MLFKLKQFLIAVLTIGAILRPTATVQAELTAQEVRQSIDRGVRYLMRQQQRARGDWPEHAGQPGGMTALCTLALLNCGVSKDEPQIRAALRFLEQLPAPEMTYASSLQIMVLCSADPDKYRALIQRNARYLENIQIKDGDRRGAWGYSHRQGKGDNSNTQFAMLALHEAQRVGVTINPQTWRLSLGYWLRNQRDDGSWGYFGDLPSTGSMTCAGIASVVIASGKFHSQDASVTNDTVICCGQQIENDAVERALGWLGDKFTVRANPSILVGRGSPGATHFLFYYLYGVERVGRLAGLRYIGDHDWYREGADMLVSLQDNLSGSWKGNGHAEENRLVATSLALLFLSKGRRPVVIGQLKHSLKGIQLGEEDRAWNHHRHAVHNLTKSIEKSWKRDLTWQNIDLREATPEQLLQAPVLFLSSDRKLDFSAKQKQALREYLEQGGFLFAESCCNSKEFDTSFRALMKELFPDSALRFIPPDHPIWFADGKIDPKFIPDGGLYGLDACCRTTVVYCPENLSCYWELNVEDANSKHSDNVMGQIKARVQIGQNVVAYATNRVLKDKLDRPVVVEDVQVEELDRGMLYVPKLSHGGGSDDAPNALVNLLRFSREQLQMRINPKRSLMNAGNANLLEHPVIFLHGRRQFRWSVNERRALATYLERGGVLAGDAICASAPFTESLKRECKAIIPGATFRRLPADHPLFTSEFGGYDVRKVKLRDPKIRRDGERLDASFVEVAPVLEALEIDGRIAVLFSPFDLSCGLENHASLDCKGYMRDDAMKLGVNMLLYLLHQ